MMSSLKSKQLDIQQIYTRYIDIVSQNNHAIARELLSMYFHSIQSEGLARNVIISDLTKLMSSLNLSVDSHQFSCFYDFVFFVFCENGQKNITVNWAVTAWRLVLAGRFRLLDQWCSFVEEHQRHNITADTWQQVLAFSRCVNEDLDGYDPKGAWPVLIDDFVEHMYRINQSNSCSTEFYCSCSDMQAEPSTFQGLNLVPGSKRKFYSGSIEFREETEGSLINKFTREETLGPLINRLKRPRHSLVPRRRGCLDSNIGTGLVNSTEHDDLFLINMLILKTSACAVDDGLAKGFE